MNPSYTTTKGQISAVHGPHCFIETDEYPRVYAKRAALNFSDPFIGCSVTLDIQIMLGSQSPVACNVRRVDQ